MSEVIRYGVNSWLLKGAVIDHDGVRGEVHMEARDRALRVSSVTVEVEGEEYYRVLNIPFGEYVTVLEAAPPPPVPMATKKQRSAIERLRALKALPPMEDIKLTRAEASAEIDRVLALPFPGLGTGWQEA